MEEEFILSITTVPEPQSRRSGRQSRLTTEDIGDLAESFQAGQWASDGEVTPTKTAAQQRGYAARDLLGEHFQLTEIKVVAYPTDQEAFDQKGDDYSEGFLWAVGPYPDGEQPRRRRNSDSPQSE